MLKGGLRRPRTELILRQTPKACRIALFAQICVLAHVLEWGGRLPHSKGNCISPNLRLEGC